MKNTVIILKVLFLATGVTAAVIDTIEDTAFDEVLREEVIFDHRNSTKGRNIPGGKSLAGMNFHAPCDWGNGGQTYWPHPTECNKFVQCGPRGPMEKTCQGNLEWSQSITTCDHPENTDVGQSPIKEGASCQCGLVNVQTKRIIGGTKVSPTRKYPWHVGLYKESEIPTRYNCGGSIISDRWVITAAHCIVESETFPNTIWNIKCRTYDVSKDNLEVWVGDHDQFTTCDNDVHDTMKYSVKQYLPHKCYQCTGHNAFDPSQQDLYDIGLIELNEPIMFNNLIRPICLPTFTSNFDHHTNDTATLTGWGTISNEKFIPSSFLREVQLEIRDNKKCWSNAAPLTLLRMCTGPSPNAGGDMGSCLSDSGSPLSVIKNNKHVLVGVVSTGTPGECGKPDNPGYYTRVAHPDILKWILDEIKKSPSKMCP